MQKLMQRKQGKKNKGFTLIELIVVIAIIGILMALAIPRLIGYTETAREAADDQLTALYKNTFAVLVGSGKAVTGTVTAGSGTTYTAATDDEDCIITVDKTGKIELVPTSTAMLVKANTDGTYAKYADADLEGIQKEFIAKGNNKGDAVIPNFKSKAYTSGTADGITITITPQGDVSVKVTDTATSSGD